MDVNMIVAAGRDGAIGRCGDLIWRIPSDLRRFKSLTMGHPVIMGRKTWESLPKKPLPGRLNIVVTRNSDYTAEGATVVTGVEGALQAAAANRDESGEALSPFVMGGAQIYDEFLPYVNRIYLTAVDAVCEDADARLPLVWRGEGWSVEDESETETTPSGVDYRYVTYRRTTADT